MSWIIEIYTTVPPDSAREPELVHKAISLGGRYDFREDRGEKDGNRLVTLTFEFENESDADAAAAAFRSEKEHVEGPTPYG